MNLLEKVKHARRAGVPLVAIETPDPGATMKTIAKGLDNGPIVGWDGVRGVYGVNEGGEGLSNGSVDPTDFLTWCQEGLPENGIAFAMNLCEYFGDDVTVMQGVWNLRDTMPPTHRMLIIVQSSIDLPLGIKDDVVVMDEPLPDDDALEVIVHELDEAACSCPTCQGTGIDNGLTCDSCNGKGKGKRTSLTKKEMTSTVEAIRGLAAFPAEQTVAMALRRKGVDLEHAWQTKIKIIEQTKGLAVYRGGETFDDLGGLNNVKEYLRSLMMGRRPPQLIVWLDEIEKSGLAHQGDTSGVNSEALGETLTHMEDHGVFGIMLLGVAGSGKSMIAKAVGAEFGKIVIRINMGAMKNELVGRSGNNLRAAFKVTSAVGSDNAVWIATSNSVAGLDSALRARFTDTFFFDLPQDVERKAIWKVWMKKYKDVTGKIPKGADVGWVGRNVQRCVDKADRFDQPVQDVAKWITPQGVIEAQTIDKLRAEADGKYLSASYDGVYHKPKPVAKKGRQMNVG